MKFLTQRPSTFKDLIGNKLIIKTVSEMEIIPNMMFYGPAGCGKTSLAKIVGKEFFSGGNVNNRNTINLENLNTINTNNIVNRVFGNILELDASDERGIDYIRTKIKEFCETSCLSFINSNTNTTLNINNTTTLNTTNSNTNTLNTTNSNTNLSLKMKLVILDECDNMTKPAQFSLRRILEDYSTHVRFILICNYENRIIDAIRSRVCRFRFKRVEEWEMVGRVSEMVERFNSIGKNLDINTNINNLDNNTNTNNLNIIEYDKEGLNFIASKSNGDMRSFVTKVSSVYSLCNTLKYNTIKKILTDNFYNNSNNTLNSSNNTNTTNLNTTNKDSENLSKIYSTCTSLLPSSPISSYTLFTTTFTSLSHLTSFIDDKKLVRYIADMEVRVRDRGGSGNNSLVCCMGVFGKMVEIYK